MIGLDAKCYYGVPGASATNELTILREVTTDLSRDDIVSAFRESDLKSHEAGQMDVTLNLVVKNKTSDAGYQALREAFLNRTLVALKVLDKASGEGPDADFAVLTMSRPEPIDGVLEVTFGVGINMDNARWEWVTA